MGHDRQSNLDRTSGIQYAKSANIDDGMLDNLSSIVSALAGENDSKDFRPLVVFFQKGYLSQVVQIWSYYAQVNNHPKFSKATTLLVKVLRELNSDSNIREYGDSMINLILSGHVRVLYRGVNAMRASITNPVFRLMKEMISFSSGQHVESFVAHFDLSLPGLVRILAVNKADMATSKEDSSGNSKSSMRDTFLDFWLELISQSSPLLRKQVISTNSKIMGAWFKLMDKIYSPQMMSRTLDVFTNLILREPSYKRTTKCQVLNELAVSKIHTFYNSPNRELVQKVDEFFLAYGSNKESSIAFPDDAVWFLSSPISGTHRGADVVVNQRNFKVYNKMLFNVLRIFKPWEDDTQLHTVIKILDNVPELVAPYAAYLASLGTHDPKMTSYWFGCTALLGRIMHLKTPSLMEQVETDIAPHTPLVMESIIPSSLSKSALTKSLQHERIIIKQLACQLIIFAFQKLEVVLELFERKGWISSKASVRNAFHLQLPDLSVISSVMNQSYDQHKGNKILQLSLSTILKYYSTVFPNFFSVKLPSSNVFIDIMKCDNFSGMDLAILETFLSFQELNGLQTKWWTKSNQEQSFFTSLLKVAKESSLLAGRICQLLDDMFRGTVAFNSNLLCSPHRALIHSLQSLPSMPERDMLKIWRVLDESVEHIMRVPYKYVDISASHNRISPFIVALLEQSKYVDAENEFGFSKKWICFYLRTMIICGEPKEGIESAVSIYLSNACQEYINGFLGVSLKVAEADEDKLFRESIMQTSFSDLVVLEKFQELSTITRRPVSKLDAAGLVFRIKELAMDATGKYDRYFKLTLEHLIFMLSNYAETDHSFTFLTPGMLKSLLQLIIEPSNSEIARKKSEFILRTMLHTYQEIQTPDANLKSTIFEWLQGNNNLLQEDGEDEETKHFLSVLLDFLGTEQCASILQQSSNLSCTSIQLLSRVLLAVPNAQVHSSVILQLLQQGSLECRSIVSQFLTQNRIKDLAIKDLLAISLSDDSYSSVTKAFTSSHYFSVDEVSTFLQNIKGQKNAILIALALHQATQEKSQEYVVQVLRSCLSFISSNDSLLSSLALELVCHRPDLLSLNEKSHLVEYLIGDYQDKYCAAVVKCIVAMGDFEDKDVAKWLNKMVLHMTKQFSSMTITDLQLANILDELQNTSDFAWQKVKSSILNTHLEAIFSGKLISREIVLKYALHVLLAVDSASTWNERLMQCLLNNESKKLRNKEEPIISTFLTASALYTLFLGDPERNSNAATQKALLSSYEGSMSAKDRLILKILERIEAQTSLSWTNLIYDWELVNEIEYDLGQGPTELLTQRKEGLVITLSKQMIERSGTNYKFDRSEIPSIKRTQSSDSMSLLTSFYQSVEDRVQSSEVYDPLFLLLLSVHNEELVKTSKTEDGNLDYNFDVKAFLSSGIFQVVLCSLGAENEVQKIALVLLEGMLLTLQKDSCPKELRIFRILLSRVVYTFMNSKVPGNPPVSAIAPCIWFAIAQLVPELAQPTSQLHDKAVHWVLSRPLLRPNELPLYQELLHPGDGNNMEQSIYYKQLGWVLNMLQRGIKTEQDVELMKRIGLLEWLANLLNMPYINGRMRSAISAIFYVSQRIGNSGSTLITRVASVATFELQKIALGRKMGFAELEVKKNSKNSRHLQKLLSLQQQNLNSVEVLSGNSVLAESNKRLRDWTENDADNIQKRIRTPQTTAITKS